MSLPKRTLSSKSRKDPRVSLDSFWGKTPPASDIEPAPLPVLADRPATVPTFRTQGAVKLQFMSGLGKRLRNVDSRDLSLIAAGLSMLLMGPIVSHLVSNESGGAAVLDAGFDRKGFSFGGFAESLAGALPSGDLEGTITALQARDPASLIISEGREERPEPRMGAVSPGRPERKSGWQDAVASAAKRGTEAATRRARLPSSGARLAGKLNAVAQASGRGGGSTGAALSLAPPSSRGLTHAAAPRSSLSRVEPTADYRGAGLRSSSSGTGSGSGFFSEGKKMSLTGANPASGGSPAGSASISRSAGSAPGGGRPSFDSAGHTPGMSSTQDGRNVSVNQKEDLARERRKMEMQKAVDLKWAKKQYNEVERKKMLEQMAAQTASQALLKVLDKGLEMLLNSQGGAEGEKKKKDDDAAAQGG